MFCNLWYCCNRGFSSAFLWIALSTSRSSANSCVQTPFASLQRDSFGGTIDIIPWDHNDGQDKCGAVGGYSLAAVSVLNDSWHSLEFYGANHCLFRVLILIQLDSGTIRTDVSEMEFSLIPNGMEGTFPEGTSLPIVSIDNLDGSPPTKYKSMGFRVLVPSYHSLLDKPFDAELQFLHRMEDDASKIAAGAPSFLTTAVWIHVDEEMDSDGTSLATIIENWRQTVELLEASCNIAAKDDNDDGGDLEEISTDSLVTGPTVPVVVGRGDEHNFANDPIRRLEEKTDVFALYDRTVLSSPFFYSFEEQVSCDWKDDAILWSFASLPLNISKEAMVEMTALLERHIDPHDCQPVSKIPMEKQAVAVTKNNAADTSNRKATKICVDVPENRSESSNAAGMPMIIFVSLVALVLL